MYLCEEGHKGVEKKRGEKESDRRQKEPGKKREGSGKRGGKATEE